MGPAFVLVFYLIGAGFIAAGFLLLGWVAALGGVIVVALAAIFEMLYKIRTILRDEFKKRDLERPRSET